MPTVTGNSTVNIISWSQTQQSVRYFDVYRRPDNVTADITTANIVAKVAAGTNHYTDPVDNSPYWYWVKAISWAGKSSAFSATIIGSPSETLSGEPTGFPNRTSSVLTWTNATRTLSISPAATSFNYYIGGVKATLTAAATVQVPDTSALSYIYFDDNVGTLVSTSSFSSSQLDTLIRTKALVAAVYYNTAGTTTYYADERHGISMPGSIHAYEHFATGFRLTSGGALNTITADASGATNDHAQFGIDAGTGLDEDISHTLSAVLSTTGCEIWYRSGANGDWVSTTNAGYSFLTGVTPLLQYNSQGPWGLTEVTNNQFALVHIFATNQVTNQYVAIVGQADYNTLVAAREGAATEISNLITNGLPDEETTPIASVILQTSNAYGNDEQTRVRSYSAAHDYVDWRGTALTPGAGPTDHGSLSNLTDDDHSQYLLLAGRSGQVIDDSLTICGAVTLNNTLNVSGATTIDGATVLKSTLTVSGACTLNNNLLVTGATTLYGITTVNNAFIVSGSSTLHGPVTVSGGLTANTLEVTGATTLKGALTISGATTINNTLQVSGNTTIEGTLTVSGAATMNAGLTLNAASQINGTLEINDQVWCSGALTVTGNVVLNGSLNISGDLTMENGNGFQNTAAGTMTINGNLNPTADNTVSLGKVGAAWANVLSNALDCNYLYPRVYIEMTAQASTPATPITGGMIRVFAKATAGVTKFCVVDTAGTVTQLGDGGATVALDNLDTVAINTSLVSDTNNTDDLGTTATRWKDIYAYSVYVGSASTSPKFTKINANAISFGGGGAGAGGLIPAVNNNESLGSSGWAWREFHAESAFITNLSVTGTAQFTGNVAFNGPTVKITGATTMYGPLIVSALCTVSELTNTGNMTTWGNAGFLGDITCDGTAKLSTLIVSGDSTLSGNLEVTGTSLMTGAVHMASFLTLDGALVCKSIGTYSGALTVNNDCKVTGALTVDGASRFNSTLRVSSDITCDGDVNCLLTTRTLNLVSSATVAFGSEGTISAFQLVALSHAWTPAGGGSTAHYGVWENPSLTPVASETSGLTGIGGFVVIGNTNKRGPSTGLSFGPYNGIGVTTGSTAIATKLVGIQTFGARGYSGTMKATEITGLNIRGCLDDGAMTSFNASSVMTIYCKANPTSLTTPAEYGIRIEELTRGTTNRVQMYLEGSQSAGDANGGHGIWFGGVTTADGGINVGKSSTNGGLFVSRMSAYTSGDDAIHWDTATRTLVNNTSTKEKKLNIRPYKDRWEDLMSVEPMQWEDMGNGRNGRGWIAEEMNEHVPELVKWSAKTGKIKGIKDRHLPMYLLEIIKIQDKRIKKLEGQITQIEERLNGLDT